MVKVRKAYKELGEKLEIRRNELGKSQQEIAENAGISQPTYARYELGTVKKLVHLKAICKALALDYEKVIPQDYSIDHLPAYLKEFVSNPENQKALEQAYAKLLWSEVDKKEEEI